MLTEADKKEIKDMMYTTNTEGMEKSATEVVVIVPIINPILEPEDLPATTEFIEMQDVLNVRFECTKHTKMEERETSTFLFLTRQIRNN